MNNDCSKEGTSVEIVVREGVSLAIQAQAIGFFKLHVLEGTFMR